MPDSPQCRRALSDEPVRGDSERKQRAAMSKVYPQQPDALPRVLRYAQPRNESYRDVFGKNCLPFLLTGRYI